MTKTTRFNVGYAFLAVLGVFVLHDLWVSYQTVTPLAYSEFQKLLQDGKIKEIVVTEGEMRGEFKKDYEPYETTGPQCGVFDQRAAETLAQHADALGFDAISAGGVLSGLMECLHDGALAQDGYI